MDNQKNEEKWMVLKYKGSPGSIVSFLNFLSERIGPPTLYSVDQDRPVSHFKYELRVVQPFYFLVLKPFYF